MNEHIDVLLTTAKFANQNNQWANIATHTISMAYNVSMLWHYNYQLGMVSAIGPGYLAAEQVQTLKQERIKHTVLLTLDCLGLLLTSFAALHENQRKQ